MIRIQNERQMTFDDYNLQTSRTAPTRYDVPTSLESARKMDKDNSKSRYRQKIFRFIQDRAGYGATCDEVEVFLGIRHQTASCFIRFLTQDLLLQDTQMRRKTRTGRNAIVWGATVRILQ